jgi:membrane-bound lytic murein transglycosylase F
VKQALPGLADPAVFKGLRHGFARGREAMQFVDSVRNYRDILERVEPRAKPLAPRLTATAQGPTTGSTPSK